MDSLFPRIRNPQYLYLVRRHATQVVRVRVKETAPRYVRVWPPGAPHARRESRKSMFHEYFDYYAQAKRALEVDYETKIAKHRAQLEQWDAELRAVQLTHEEDL